MRRSLGLAISGIAACALAIGMAAPVSGASSDDGVLKVHVQRAGTYTVSGAGLRTTADSSRSFTVAPGTYRITAERAVITPATVKVLPGSTVAATVTFGSPVQASAIATGCAVLTDGTVTCWTPDAVPTPAVVPGVDHAIAVSTGGDHACAVLADGTVKCWGKNATGQLGDGTLRDSATPVVVTGVDDAIAVTAGYGYTCALLADRSARCWGDNTYGQLGDGTMTWSQTVRPEPVTHPVPVQGLTDATQISAGMSHTCAALSDGSLRCWGSTTSGALGEGTYSQNPPLGIPHPVRVEGIDTATAVSAGVTHSCAVLRDGSVRCWGLNGERQLGNGRQVDSATPVQVVGLQRVTAVAAGWAHTCAATTEGELLCWGQNNVGQLGFAGADSYGNPVLVPGAGSVRGVAALGERTCVHRTDATVACWGWWEYAHTATGGLTRASGPLPVAGLGHARQVVTGYEHSCAVKAGGRVECWGSNTYQQLGRLSPVISWQPLGVPGVRRSVALASGVMHTCSLSADGRVTCWGCLRFGYFGCEYLRPSEPTRVPGIRHATAIAAGDTHTCVLLRSGRIRCWGNGAKGKLGAGKEGLARTPVPVKGIRSAKAISANSEHTCAVLKNGTVTCWGCIGPGCLASDPDYEWRAARTPRRVPGISDAVAVTTGANHSCALLATRRVTCWGYSAEDEYGESKRVWKAHPVSGVSDVWALFSGADANYAVTTGGQVVRWRGNGVGVRVKTAEQVKGAVSGTVGDTHACVLRKSGAVLCWGDNTWSQVGQAGPLSRFSLVLVTEP